MIFQQGGETLALRGYLLVQDELPAGGQLVLGGGLLDAAAKVGDAFRGGEEVPKIEPVKGNRCPGGRDLSVVLLFGSGNDKGANWWSLVIFYKCQLGTNNFFQSVAILLQNLHASSTGANPRHQAFWTFPQAFPNQKTVVHIPDEVAAVADGCGQLDDCFSYVLQDLCLVAHHPPPPFSLRP